MIVHVNHDLGGMPSGRIYRIEFSGAQACTLSPDAFWRQFIEPIAVSEARLAQREAQQRATFLKVGE